MIMIRKITRINFNEISAIGLFCQFCQTTTQYRPDKEIGKVRCPGCENEYPDGVYEGLTGLYMAIGHLRQDKKNTVTLEIEPEKGSDVD